MSSENFQIYLTLELAFKLDISNECGTTANFLLSSEVN